MDSAARSPAASRLYVLRRGLAAATGTAFGVLFIKANNYAAIKWGDDFPVLNTDGVMGSVVGYCLLASPLFFGWLAWRHSLLFSAWSWAVVVLTVLVAVLLVPAEIDCGDSLSGYRCAGQSGDR